MSLLRKHPRISMCIFNLFIVFLGFITTEITLRHFIPFYIPTIGHKYSRNAQLYGWGFNPYEGIYLQNPDTGETYFSHANNRGWRDNTHDVKNKKNSYRILILGDSNTFGPNVPADKIYPR